MARRTFPRPERHHELAAQRVLERHEAATGVAVTLPVPIEMIIEVTYGLRLEWNNIPEPPDTMILGALFPRQQRIVINTKHLELLESVIGPERFTLAHELAHLLYDADDPNQLELALDEPNAPEQYCYNRETSGLSDDLRIREINANKLAAHILLPTHLVRAIPVHDILANFRDTARSWGVSQQTLRIRLESLGLIGRTNGDRLPGW